MFNKQKREEKELAVKNIKQPIRHDYENEELKVGIEYSKEERKLGKKSD